jgi:hypothetical protein
LSDDQRGEALFPMTPPTCRHAALLWYVRVWAVRSGSLMALSC